MLIINNPLEPDQIAESVRGCIKDCNGTGLKHSLHTKKMHIKYTSRRSKFGKFHLATERFATSSLLINFLNKIQTGFNIYNKSHLTIYYYILMYLSKRDDRKRRPGRTSECLKMQRRLNEWDLENFPADFFFFLLRDNLSRVEGWDLLSSRRQPICQFIISI